MILFNNTPLFTLGGSSPFWVSTAFQSTPSGPDRLEGSNVSLRTDGDLLVSGGFFGPLGVRGEAYAKYTPQGDAVESPKFLFDGGFPSASAKVDPVTGNQYVLGQTSGLTIYDSDFLFLSRTRQSDGDIRKSDPKSFDIDDAGNAYCGARAGLGAGPRLLKVDSSGSIVWRRSLTRADFRTSTVRVAVNKSDGTVYLGIHNSDLGVVDSFVPILASYTSAGSLRWQKRFTSPSVGASTGFNVHPQVSSAGDVYMAFVTGGSGLTGIAVMKVSESGDIIWQKIVSLGGDADRATLDQGSTHFGADNHFYLCYRERLGNSDLRAIILKIDTSGDLVWAVSFVDTGSSIAPRVSDMLTVNESLYLAGSFAFTLARVSSDGVPLSGGVYDISRVTRTLTNGDYVTSNSNLTNSNLSLGEIVETTDAFTDVASLSTTLTRL